MSSVDEVLGAIGDALEDWEVGPDAVRAPERVRFIFVPDTRSAETAFARLQEVFQQIWPAQLEELQRLADELAPAEMVDASPGQHPMLRAIKAKKQRPQHGAPDRRTTRDQPRGAAQVALPRRRRAPTGRGRR